MTRSATRAELRRRELVDRLLAEPDLRGATASDLARQSRHVRWEFLREGRPLLAWDAHLLARSARRIARGGTA